MSDISSGTILLQILHDGAFAGLVYGEGVAALKYYNIRSPHDACD